MERCTRDNVVPMFQLVHKDKSKRVLAKREITLPTQSELPNTDVFVVTEFDNFMVPLVLGFHPNQHLFHKNLDEWMDERNVLKRISSSEGVGEFATDKNKRYIYIIDVYCNDRGFTLWLRGV